MTTVRANSGRLAHVAPQVERFINRHFLGLQPDPDQWPAPLDLNRLTVPAGIVLNDETGQTLILSHEFMPAWHRRRTAVGAHAYRFERNGEYDCGWRLAGVAARFIRRHGHSALDFAGIVPPPGAYGSRRVLPWVAERLARTLDIAFEPSLFETACPLGNHPDVTKRLLLPLTEMFRINDAYDSKLANARVLLIDWRLHRGRTLLTLARMLRKKGAEVLRFTWLG